MLGAFDFEQQAVWRSPKAGASGPSPQQRRVKSAVQENDLAWIESSEGEDRDDEDLQMVSISPANSVAPPWFRTFNKRISKQLTGLQKKLDKKCLFLH